MLNPSMCGKYIPESGSPKSNALTRSATAWLGVRSKPSRRKNPSATAHRHLLLNLYYAYATLRSTTFHMCLS